MSFFRKSMILISLLLAAGAAASGAVAGPGEILLRSGNRPEGVAVTRLESVRKIEIEAADPRHLAPLFSGETGKSAGKLRKRTASFRRDLLFSIENSGIRGRETARLRDMVRLNLFRDLEATAYLSRVDQTGESFTWAGDIEGRADRGTVNLTYSDGIFLGRVNIYGRGIFTISPGDPGFLVIEERDPSEARFAPPLLPDIELSREALSRESLPGSDVARASDGAIEIMVVWSLDAEAGASAQGSSIQAEVANAISLINTTYANSGIFQRVTLVASARTDYVSTEDSYTDLERLQNPTDGFMDEIHQLRESSGADCVSLITNGFDGSIIGQGYALYPQYNQYFKYWAFSVVDRHFFYYQTLTHELGHNMGAGHELDNVSSPGPQYYTYSSGYHYKVSDFEHWHTMMSYSHEGSDKIEFFSNPGVSFEGNPTGLPGENGNNNALTLNNTRNLVDSFGEGLSPDLSTCNYVGDPYFAPSSLETGEELEISITVCNLGQGPAGAFRTEFYLSENQNITESDHYLGDIHSSGIEDYSYTSFLWIGEVPAGTPDGKYYVGWIIDPDNEVSESNESNNTSYFTPEQLSVSQHIECAYTITPASQTYNAAGGSSSVSVTCPSGCSWEAVSQADWITVRAESSSGDGNGSVVYFVSPNPSYDQRTGRIRIADKYFSVTQRGAEPVCTYSLLPESAVLDAEGGEGSISVACPSGCSWTASAQEDWITVLAGQSGSGNGTISYSVQENPGKYDRTGSLQVQDQSFQVTQRSSYTTLEKQDRIVFPAGFGTMDPLFGNSFVGVTALNLNESDKTVSFSGIDSQGNTVDSNSGFPALEPLGQLARLSTELLDPNPQIATITGDGDGSGIPVSGIFVLGDNQTRRLDGIGHRWVSGKELYLLQGTEKSGQVTTIYLFNTSPDTEAAILLEWKGRDGSILDTRHAEIQAGGTLFQTLSSLFAPIPDSPDGYLRITSSTEICGFSLAATEDTFVSFPALAPAETSALYAPHFLLLPDGSGTELQLVNVGQLPVSIVFQTFDEPGTEFETQGMELPAGAMLKGNLTEFIPLDPGNLGEEQILTGEMKISISPVGDYEGLETPEVIGGVTLSGSARNSAGLPLEPGGWKKIIFPHVAQSLDMKIFTGLAVWNTNSEVSEVTVRAWDKDGLLSGNKTFTLEPNQRRVGMLNEPWFFDSGFSQVGGHLEVTCARPVIAFCLYGDFELEYLSTIGGQGTNLVGE